MNKIKQILLNHETNIKHRPRCIDPCDYNKIVDELTEFINNEKQEAFKKGYIASGVIF